MVKYKGKYILEGLDSIPPEMEADLELAFEICERYEGRFECEMCGRCCHQPNILLLPHEIDRVSHAARIPLDVFVTKYLVGTTDGRMLFRKSGACNFLGKDNRCTIWGSRPDVCRSFPYLVSKFASRVYLAIVNDVDIWGLIDYMDESWPCTRKIKESISSDIEDARRKRVAGV